MRAEQRQSWEAGGSALDGQDTTRKTWGQTRHVAPQLHPAVTGVNHEGGREEDEGEEQEERKSGMAETKTRGYICPVSKTAGDDEGQRCVERWKRVRKGEDRKEREQKVNQLQ